MKYIFSMVAGLIVMVTTSCSEKTTTEVENEASAVAEADTAETPATSTDEAVASASAYYVMFKGDGG